jgi:hypothetical protein
LGQSENLTFRLNVVKTRAVSAWLLTVYVSAAAGEVLEEYWPGGQDALCEQRGVLL